jgi:hypothetical protein
MRAIAPDVLSAPAVSGRIETNVAIGRKNRFRLQKQYIFERIPLTAEVTACVRGGSVFDRPYSRSLQCAPQLAVGFEIEEVRR